MAKRLLEALRVHRTAGDLPIELDVHGGASVTFRASERAGRVWDTADHVASVRSVYAEARATLGQAARLGRLAASELAHTVAALDELYDQLALLEVDDPLVRQAGELAELQALRGYGAVRVAAAERVTDDTTVLLAGDRDLLAAAATVGLAVSDTSSESL